MAKKPTPASREEILKMKIPQLRQYAFQHGINLQGRDAKGDIQELILAAHQYEPIAPKEGTPATGASGGASGDDGGTPAATVRINGGEPIDATTEEGRALLDEKLSEFAERAVNGEAVLISINDGPEYPIGSPELEAEIERVGLAYEADEDDSDDAAAGDAQTGEATPAVKESLATEKAAATATPSVENPNEKFTESLEEKAAANGAGEVEISREEVPLPNENAAEYALEQLLQFESQLQHSLHSQPAVQAAFSAKAEYARKVLAALKASKK